MESLSVKWIDMQAKSPKGVCLPPILFRVPGVVQKLEMFALLVVHQGQ